MTPKPPARAKQEALGRTISTGVSWMVIATSVTKVFSFVSTIVLGILLTKDDYAVYGIAIGIAAFAQILRDGGMKQILIQKQAFRYPRLSGPVFWMSAVLNGMAGLLLGAAAWPLAAWYGEPELGPVLLATAVSIILTTPLGIYRAKMSVDLRYRQLATLQAWSSVSRYSTMILFAAMGLGPLSFTLPLVVRVLVEGVYGFIITRDKPWTRPPRLRLWPAIWGQSKWLFFGTFAMSMLSNGDYLVLGWLKVAGHVSMAAVGQYVFAYQIAVQINIIVAGNLQAVIFPALSRLAAEPARHARAVLRATRIMTLVGSGMGLGLACIFEPLQVILWNQKWEAATGAVFWMAAFFPMRLLTSVLNAAQMSKGRFREWFLLSLLQGAGMMGAAAIAGIFFDTSGAIAMVIGIYFTLGVAPTALWGLKRCGVPVRATAGAVVPAWVLACGAAAATLALADLVPMPAGLPPRLLAAVEMLLRGSLFGLLYLAGLRAVLPGALAEVVDIAPKRYGRRVSRVFLLRTPDPIKPGV